MELFYSNQIFEDHLFLNAEESGHCIKVLRKTRGDIINVIDGKGNLFEGPIEVESKNKPVKVRIQKKTVFDSPEFQSGFHLVIAPTKNADRMEWMVEKTVEMGIASITFLQCEHSERTNLRLDRIEKIAIAALKQSGQYWLPKILLPMPFKKFMEEFSGVENGYIAYCSEGEKFEFGCKPLNKICTVLIGPEGDFSQTEIEMAIKSGYQGISLGASRLRTETAALYACSIFRNNAAV